MRTLKAVIFGALLAGTFALSWWARSRLDRPSLPDGPAIIERVREVARLEALDVVVSKTVSFEPDPRPAATLVGELASWARYTVNPPEGRALVVGVAHLGVDLARLDANGVRVSGDTVQIDLPPVTTTVELLPDRTEIVRSNLDSQQTAALLQHAKNALAGEVALDRALQDRARAAAASAIARLLNSLGFRDVRVGPPGVG